MNRRIRAASLCAALAAAVLVGGTAQAYAAASSAAPARPHAAVAPADAPTALQEGTSAQAIDIWRWAGRYDTYVAAEAAYWVLYGLGSAVQQRIEQVWVDGAYRWELYIQ
ncbi:hypothetical protein ACIQI7_05475 [Kitasatospora sp. NPDC092039]|uniref:hypothetical protein n=1 Tax=Kitasatospora sp. NPDC092039 TaxID=3364086 RepID=UPI0038050F4F